MTGGINVSKYTKSVDLKMIHFRCLLEGSSKFYEKIESLNSLLLKFDYGPIIRVYVTVTYTEIKASH